MTSETALVIHVTKENHLVQSHSFVTLYFIKITFVIHCSATAVMIALTLKKYEFYAINNKSENEQVLLNNVFTTMSPCCCSEENKVIPNNGSSVYVINYLSHYYECIY